MNVLIKYYGFKLLCTVDLNYLVSNLGVKDGDSLALRIEEMDDAEKDAAIDSTSGIDLVRRRISVFVDGVRQAELEKKFNRLP
jgi:hypothetical protein